MITSQRIVDILEARYAELEAEMRRLEASGHHGVVKIALEQDVLSRINELEIVLDRISTDRVTVEAIQDAFIDQVHGDEA